MIPPARRETRGETSFRYYGEDDIPRYRTILNSPPPVRKRRVQLFLSNLKGMGKSSLAANYLRYISGLGVKCLAIDMDPKGDLSSYLGAPPTELRSTIGQILLAEGQINGAAFPVNTYLHLIPGNPLLISASLELNSHPGNDNKLNYLLRKHREDYDLVVIDVNSHPDIFMINAILAADDIIMPVNDGSDNSTLMISLNMLDRILQEYSGTHKKNVYIFENKVEKKGTHKKPRKIKDIVSLDIHYLKKSIRYDRRYDALSKNHQTAVIVYPRSGVTKDIKTLAEAILLED